MLGTHAAGFFEALPQLPAGAMMTHPQVVGGHSQRCADILRAFARQIESANQFRVVGIERWDQ